MRPTRLAGPLTMLSTLAAAFLIWNVVVGMLVQSNPGLVQNPDLGPSYRPGSTTVHGREGFARLTFDTLGFNNDEVPSKTDVLVLGDSHTEALQVDRSENFVTQTQRLLASQGTPLHFYNAGISARSWADFLAWGPGFVRVMKPSVTVVQVTRGDFAGDTLDATLPVRLVPDGTQWKLVTTQRQTTTVETLRGTFLAAVPLVGLWGSQWREGAFGKPWGERPPFLPAAPRSPRRPAGLDQKLVNWEVEQLKAVFGPRLVVLFLRYGPNLTSSGSIRVDAEGDEDAWRALKEATDAAGVTVVDVGAAFRELVDHGHRFPRGFENTDPDSGHLNRWGHAAVAEVLAPAILASLAEQP